MPDYLTTGAELTSIADAIRTKGGTSASLEYPNGFISAIQAIPTGGGTFQSKTVSPTESQQTVTPDSGYDALSSVTVNAISSSYVGSGVARKSSSDLTASGATVTAPAGYYDSAASKAVSSGSASTPATTITANPTISVNSSTGLITATASASESVTPSVTEGYVSSGTAGTVTVSGSNTSQLTTKAAETITPGTSDIIIASGKFLTGAQTIKGDANLVGTNIKTGVSIFGVAGSYSGGLDFSKAIIHVIAPTGSTLTFSSGGSTIGTLTPNDAISDGWETGYSDYFFPVSTSQYGTITISSDPVLNSKSVTVSDVKLYTVYLVTQLDLYNAGSFASEYTYSTETQNATVTYDASRITLKGSNNRVQSAYVIWDNVDLSSFDHIYLYRSHPTDNNNRYTGLFITQDPTVRTAMAASIVEHYSVPNATTSSITTLDISAYSGYWYVGVGYDTNGGSWNVGRTEYINRVMLA